MLNRAAMQTPSFFSKAVPALVLVALAAACDSPTAPIPKPDGQPKST